MAVAKKANSNAKGNNKNNKEKDKDNISYSYGNSSLNFWNTETMIKLAFRKMSIEGGKKLPEVVISIYPLDENRKMIKNEDGKYENGYFNMNFNDLLKFVYGVRRTIYPTKKENFAGAICSHISSENNNGSQLEFIVTDEGFSVNILYIEDGEVVNSYEHILNNDQVIKYYDEEGEAAEKTVNVDVIGFLFALESALSSAGGMTSSLIEAWGGGSGGGGKYSGTLKNNRSIGKSGLSKRLGNLDEDEEEEEADSDSEVEEEETEEEEVVETQKKKPVVKGKVNKPTSAKSMKAILDEDDD